MRNLTIFFLLMLTSFNAWSQEKLDMVLPVRGICLSAPKPEGVDKYVNFIRDELIPQQVNTLVILIDYGYAFKSRPELAGENPLSEQDVKKNRRSMPGRRYPDYTADQPVGTSILVPTGGSIAEGLSAI
jgi:hypothetical protein